MIYLNDVLITPTIFPDKCSQTWQIPENSIETELGNHIQWNFDHEGEFLQLAQLKNLLDTISPYSWKGLILKYLPYGRQDKEISNKSTFALRTFSELLNSLEFNDILIQDPHSKIALELINNSRDIYPIYILNKVYKSTSSDLVCYPDQGALDKYTKIYRNYEYLYGEKVRDQLTGNIMSYKLFGDPKDKNVLIVDDICDYGNTFIKLSKELLDKGAKEVNLFVTYGLFSGGLKPLKNANINRIFTAEGEISEFQERILITPYGK